MIITRTLTQLCILLLLTLPVVAQDYKVVKEIANSLVEDKAAWASQKKYSDFPKGTNFSLSKSDITINNKGENPYGFGEPTSVCREYVNGKFSVTIEKESGDPAAFSGIAFQRWADISTVRSGFAKTRTGPMDFQERYYYFLLNGNGDVKITRTGTDQAPDQVIFNALAVKPFQSGKPNTLAIERKGLSLSFLLNGEKVFSYRDNSTNSLADIKFRAGENSKTKFENFQFVYYDNRFAAYERAVSGSTTIYNDNECGFKIIESSIEKQCPTAELNTNVIRYYSVYCEKQTIDFGFGVLFFKKDEKVSDPIADFLDKYVRELYGDDNAETFNAKKDIFSKENEAGLVAQIQQGFKEKNTSYKNIEFSAPGDLLIGNIKGRYFDISYERDGKRFTQQKFYAYLPKGLMLVQFDAPYGTLVANEQYQQVLKNIYSL